MSILLLLLHIRLCIQLLPEPVRLKGCHTVLGRDPVDLLLAQRHFYPDIHDVRMANVRTACTGNWSRHYTDSLIRQTHKLFMAHESDFNICILIGGNKANAPKDYNNENKQYSKYTGEGRELHRLWMKLFKT
jgi:hypothetical protein